MAVIAMLSVTAFGWMAIGVSEQALLESRLEHLAALASARATVFEVLVDDRLNDARLIASRTRMRTLFDDQGRSADGEAIDQLVPILQDAATTDIGIVSVSLIDRRGVIAATTDPTLAGVPVERAPASFGTVPEPGSPETLQPIITAGSVQLVTFTPVNLAGRNLGTLHVRFDGSALDTAIEDDSFARTGRVLTGFADEAAGVVRPLTSGSAGPVDDGAPLAELSDAAHPMVRALAGDDAVVAEGAVDIAGTPVLAVARSIPELDLGLVVTIDRDEAVGHIARIRTAYASVAIVLALAGVAGIGVMRQRQRDELKARRRAEDRFTSMFTTSPTPTLLVGADGSIRMANERAAQLLGYSRDQLGQKFVDRLVPAAGRAGLRQLRKRLDECPDARRMGVTQTLAALAADGREIPVEVSLTPIDTDEGPMVIAALIDLTERREAEAVLERWAEQLTRSNRDLEEFAYIASHDLKSPLRAMENLASFIMEDAAEKLPEQSRLDLHQIRQRSRRLLALIDGLLQYARIGRDEVVASWVDTGALFAEMGELYLPPERFELVLQSDLPPIFAPRPAVELVFRNLLMNVEKHHDRDRGRVEITGHQEGQAVQFVVADDGPGIPSEHHERVFELFRTLESRDKKEASGLGLTLIKRLLDTHGGTIAIMPSEGRGTSFVVSWPCWQIPSGRGRELADGVAAEPVQAR